MIDRKSALLYSKLNSFKGRCKYADNFISDSLQKVSNPYVACSFGKDSSVMLHLILKYSPEIPVRFATHPETNILDNYQEIIKWWVDNYNINLQEIFCDGGLVKVKHHQRNMLDKGEWDSFFVGIRKQESVARRITLRTYGKFHKLKNGRVKISPLADWTEKEIETYLVVNEIPFLSKYEVEGVNARTASGIARTHIGETLQSLKNRDINKFNELCKLFEDAKYYV